jgi:uncharacterized protein YeeX (DUF496 family)
MSAYIKLQTAAREINDVQREVINFNKKLMAINLLKDYIAHPQYF